MATPFLRSSASCPASSTTARSSSSSSSSGRCAALAAPSLPARGAAAAPSAAPSRGWRRGSSLVVRAEPPANVPPPPPPPAGVSMPPVEPQEPLNMFGFVDWAEKINSRAAMIGFFALLAVEGITGKPFLELIGFAVGNGIDIGF